MVTGNDESKMSEFEDAQQQEQQQQDQDPQQQQQQQVESESGSEDSDPCPAGALSSKFDRTDTSINTNPLPYGKYTLIGIDIDTTGRRLIDEIVQISAYTPDHQHSQYIMPLMNLNPAARQRHQVRVITVGFFRMLKSMQTYRVVKTKTEISALNEFIGWLEQRAREDPDSEGIVLIYHEQRKFVPYMLIEALKKYNLLDRFAQTVRSFANGFKLAEEKCSKTIKYFSIRQLAKLVLDESEAKDGFEGNAAYRARLAYQIARRLSNDNKESASGETSQEETSVVTKSDNEAESEDAAAATEADDADADADATAPVAPVSTGAIPKASRDMGNYTASSSVENANDGQQQEQPQQQQEDSEEDDQSGTDVDVVTGHVTTIPEPQPRSRPTTEAEREKMCAVLCELASPITCEISELDEQEVILVRQNSLRPVFLQYFKTTIYHRVKAVTYRRVLAEYGHDFASLHQIWTESKREGLEYVTAKISELKDDERAELVELLDCHYDPDKQQLKPIVKRIRPRSNRGPGRPFFGNKNNNSANGVGNPNNNNNKENRKPMGGRNGAGNNNNTGTFYANNSNNNNNNNNGKHNNNNQPPSPNGNGNGNGAGGKKFRQRQPRRRRSNQNNKSEAPQNFQQNQPQMIQTNA